MPYFLHHCVVVFKRYYVLKINVQNQNKVFTAIKSFNNNEVFKTPQ